MNDEIHAIKFEDGTVADIKDQNAIVDVSFNKGILTFTRNDGSTVSVDIRKKN